MSALIATYSCANNTNHIEEQVDSAIRAEDASMLDSEVVPTVMNGVQWWSNTTRFKIWSLHSENELVCESDFHFNTIHPRPNTPEAFPASGAGRCMGPDETPYHFSISTTSIGLYEGLNTFNYIFIVGESRYQGSIELFFSRAEGVSGELVIEEASQMVEYGIQ
ncbi:MAG: hypothetical protein ACE366_20750 [Bradymonadia bacterium]